MKWTPDDRPRLVHNRPHPRRRHGPQLLGYLGLALLLRTFINFNVAATTVSLFPIACAAFGVRHGVPATWAWPLHQPTYLPAFIAATALGAAGLAAATLPVSTDRPARPAQQ